MQCLEPADEQTNSPPLPPRPQHSQYIELGLVPINKNSFPFHNLPFQIKKSDSCEDLQEETRFDQTHAKPSERSVNSLLKTTETSFEHYASNMSELTNIEINLENKTGASNEIINQTAPSNDIDEVTIGRMVNIYDMPTTSHCHLENNKYTSFTDNHHASQSVDIAITNADCDEYLIPSEPVVYTDTQAFTHSIDWIEMLDQPVSANNDVTSENESYIYPIDPDD